MPKLRPALNAKIIYHRELNFGIPQYYVNSLDENGNLLIEYYITNGVRAGNTLTSYYLWKLQRDVILLIYYSVIIISIYQSVHF